MFKTAFSNQNIDRKGLKYAGVDLRELCILLRLVCKRRGIFIHLQMSIALQMVRK